MQHSYRSKYSLILLDECVLDELSDYIKDNIENYLTKYGIKLKNLSIITVKHNPLMEGMLDKDLADMCYDYNGVLITSDRKFFKEYLGYKILFYKCSSLGKILQKTARFLENNSIVNK